MPAPRSQNRWFRHGRSRGTFGGIPFKRQTQFLQCLFKESPSRQGRSHCTITPPVNSLVTTDSTARFSPGNRNRIVDYYPPLLATDSSCYVIAIALSAGDSHVICSWSGGESMTKILLLCSTLRVEQTSIRYWRNCATIKCSTIGIDFAKKTWRGIFTPCPIIVERTRHRCRLLRLRQCAYSRRFHLDAQKSHSLKHHLGVLQSGNPGRWQLRLPIPFSLQSCLRNAIMPPRGDSV